MGKETGTLTGEFLALSAAWSRACWRDSEPLPELSPVGKFGKFRLSPRGDEVAICDLGDMNGFVFIGRSFAGGVGEGCPFVGVVGLSWLQSREGVVNEECSSSNMRFPMPTWAVSSIDVRVGVRSPPVSDRPLTGYVVSSF